VEDLANQTLVQRCNQVQESVVSHLSVSADEKETGQKRPERSMHCLLYMRAATTATSTNHIVFKMRFYAAANDHPETTWPLASLASRLASLDMALSGFSAFPAWTLSGLLETTPL